MVTRLYARYFAGSGLEPAQFTLLVAVRLSEPVPLVKLADSLALERTTFTRNLRLLLRDGLVKVSRGEDARTRLVSVTEAGRRAIRRSLPRWKRAQQAAISSLGKDGFVRLSEALALSTKFNRQKGD